VFYLALPEPCSSLTAFEGGTVSVLAQNIAKGPRHHVLFFSSTSRSSSGACERGVVSLRGACLRAATLAREELRPRASMTTPPQPTALGMSSCDTRAVLNGFTRLPEHPRVPLPLTCRPRTQGATIKDQRSRSPPPLAPSSPSPPPHHHRRHYHRPISPRDHAPPLHPARACPPDRPALSP
jgi:hypothetical protein